MSNSLTSAAPQKRFKGQTVDERRRMRRRMLVRAATLLFARNGFRNTSVRAICQEADLTERYFYESFANREDLIAFAFEKIVARLEQKMREADDQEASPAQRLRAVMRAYFTALQENPDGSRLFLVEILGISPDIDLAFAKSLERLSQPFIDIVDPLGTGPLKNYPLLRQAAAGATLHIALAWTSNGFKEPIETIIETTVLTAAMLCDETVRRQLDGA